MEEASDKSVLQRMVTPAGPVVADVPVSAARAVRLSVSRAAEQSIGLALSVSSVAEDAQPLDAALDALEPDLLFLNLMKNDEPVAFVACDFGVVSAAGEVRTIGKPSKLKPHPRPFTAIDVSLVTPVLARMISELDEATTGTRLEGCAQNLTLGPRISGKREIGLTLSHTDYRIIRVALDIVEPDRTGELILALPLPARPQPEDNVEQGAQWAQAFQETVLAGTAAFNVVLHRFSMPIDALENLKVGDVVPLEGCNIGSARLETFDQQHVATGKLGQMGGHLALRIGAPDIAQMSDLAAPKPADAPIADQPDPALLSAGDHV